MQIKPGSREDISCESRQRRVVEEGKELSRRRTPSRSEACPEAIFTKTKAEGFFQNVMNSQVITMRLQPLSCNLGKAVELEREEDGTDLLCTDEI